MIARKLTHEETLWSNRNMAVCFHDSFDEKEAREALIKEPVDDSCTVYGAFDEDEDTLVSSLIVNHFDVRFDGTSVRMGGIGGVATLPAYRKQGLIRGLFQESHRDMYHAGYAFSALYPFSLAYYKQFGYQPGATYCQWTIHQRDLAGLPKPQGHIRQLFPGDSFAPLLEVYHLVTADVNLSVLRKAFDPEMEKKNFLNNQCYVFVYEEAGKPCGALIGQRIGDELHCEPAFSHRGMSFFFHNVKGLLALLSFLHAAYAENYDTIILDLPEAMDLYSLLPLVRHAGEGSVQCKRNFNGMIRVVHTETALKQCQCQGRGEICIRVDDPLLPENTGVYQLQFSEGNENVVRRVDEEPDIIVGPGTLAQLLLGCKSTEHFDWMPEVQVLHPSAPLAQVFYRKKCMMYDLF